MFSFGGKNSAPTKGSFEPSKNYEPRWPCCCEQSKIYFEPARNYELGKNHELQDIYNQVSLLRKEVEDVKLLLTSKENEVRLLRKVVEDVKLLLTNKEKKEKKHQKEEKEPSKKTRLTYDIIIYYNTENMLKYATAIKDMICDRDKIYDVRVVKHGKIIQCHFAIVVAELVSRIDCPEDSFIKEARASTSWNSCLSFKIIRENGTYGKYNPAVDIANLYHSGIISESSGVGKKAIIVLTFPYLIRSKDKESTLPVYTQLRTNDENLKQFWDLLNEAKNFYSE